MSSDKNLEDDFKKTIDQDSRQIMIVDGDLPKKQVIVHRNGQFTPEGDKMIHSLESTLLKKGLKVIKNEDGSYKLDEKGQIEVKLMKSNFTKPKKKRK